MTEADQLFAEAKAAGVTITRDGDRLHLRACAPPDEELLRRLREAKADLMPIAPLQPPTPPDTGGPEVAWRIEAMRPQLPAVARPIPLLLARPEVPYQTGHCLSCGDLVAAVRCAPCRAAVAVVLGEWTASAPTVEGTR
ncbi:MAG: hypothetical protein ACREN1_07105 [Candidatus Dormibacteria bacterium]